MKLYKFLILFLFVTFFLFIAKVSAEAAFAPYRKLCVGIQGKFSADSNWHGGHVQIGCGGDNGLAVPASRRAEEACLGEIQTVEPGQSFRLTKCSCFGTDKGCLKMGRKLELGPMVDGKRKIIIVTNIKDTEAFKKYQCRHTDLSPICGSNGQHITGNIKISCIAPTKTPTPTTKPSLTPTKTPTPTRNPSLTPTPFICPKPDTVTNVKVSCPNCFAEVTSPTPTEQPSN